MTHSIGFGCSAADATIEKLRAENAALNDWAAKQREQIAALEKALSEERALKEAYREVAFKGIAGEWLESKLSGLIRTEELKSRIDAEAHKILQAKQRV